MGIWALSGAQQPLAPEIPFLEGELHAERQISNYSFGSVSFAMCCSLSSGGLLTATVRCDVLTPLPICFSKSDASLFNFHLGGSMLPNRLSKAQNDLPLFCDLGEDLGILQC